ncbi:MAG: ABC transporter permease [Acidobacteria bacterium]|nr:ABC transporter permease [Acidobacteriota bacterium]
MRVAAFALRQMARQPARSVLGIAALAIIGALLFDMLLLSRGLVLSFGDLLRATGFTVRVTATEALPSAGPPLRGAEAALREVEALGEVEQALALRFGQARARVGERQQELSLVGSSAAGGGSWTVIAGSDLPATAEAAGAPPPVVINEALARDLGAGPGDRVRLRGACSSQGVLLPPIETRVVGVAQFRFDAAGDRSAATTLGGFTALCPDQRPDEADLLLARPAPGITAEAAAAAIRRALPGLHAFSNAQFLARFERTDFSYFRQISFVLSSITAFFAGLLVTTLLTVSVNQRYGEIAALRAIGLTRRRVAGELAWESALFVLAGGALSLPLGWGLALVLDSILRGVPGLPVALHFFVFEPRSLVAHAALLGGAAALAALWPVWLVARLPIAATLREETVG